jgi:transglutaminase-like putative cysteine protease
MRVTLSHTTRLQYSGAVIDGVMDVRLGPASDAHQQWVHFNLAVEPAATINRYVDGFGNAAHLITLRRAHDSLEIVSGGEVETLLENPFVPPARPPVPLTAAEYADGLTPSALVPADPRLASMAEPFRPSSSAADFDAVQKLMHLVHADFAYEQLATDVSTTVKDVLDHGQGVCQDFAHVLIGLCRAIDVPARYVSGYIVTAIQSANPAPRGASASHAWVEAFTPTHGWRGFDPTNNLLASTHHVKIATGRDYRDASPSRGSYRGNCNEHLSVNVVAHPVD